MIQHVLIIDPIPTYAKFLKSRLKVLYNCKITFAGRTQIGLEELSSQYKTPFDLIFLDINQPDSDEIEAVVKVVKKKGNCPLVVFADKIDPTIMFHALSIGAADFLEKSVVSSSEKLNQIITVAIDRHNNWSQIEQ